MENQKVKRKFKASKTKAVALLIVIIILIVLFMLLLTKKNNPLVGKWYNEKDTTYQFDKDYLAWNINEACFQLLIDSFSLFIGILSEPLLKWCGLYALDVLLQLDSAAGTNQYGGDTLLLQYPGKCHFRHGLASGFGYGVPFLQLLYELRSQGILAK